MRRALTTCAICWTTSWSSVYLWRKSSVNACRYLHFLGGDCEEGGVELEVDRTMRSPQIMLGASSCVVYEGLGR